MRCCLFLLLAVSLSAETLVLGHRGCRALRPENTIAAFEHALQVGADILELDVVVTQDNQLVVHHDLDLAGKSVHSMTLAEVRERIHGGRISGDATLILEGDVRLENVTIPEGTSLVVHAKDDAPALLKDFIATSASRFVIHPLTDEEMNSTNVPEYLRIRGYRILQSADIS
jgi:glycerophosphoryl diester phosphodiesterase